MKNLKAASTVMVIFMAAALAFAGTTAYAASPDANVKGLWLKAPAFPADQERVEVLKFEDDQEMGVTTYARSLDGMVTFEIRRQPIEESELRGPDDVEGLIEFRVYNEADRAISEENWAGVKIMTDMSELSQRFSYPCAVAQYTTGANEDTRKNASLFIFTDTYSFEVMVSMSPDAEEDYAEQSRIWLHSLRLKDNKKPAGGNMQDASARIKGLWLEIPSFPEDIETETQINDEGMTGVMAKIDDGLILAIARTPNPQNTLTTNEAAKILAGLSDVAEDEIDVHVLGEGDVPFPASEKNPGAMAEYASAGKEYGSGGEEKEVMNMAILLFPNDFFFLVHLQAENQEVVEKHMNEIEMWFRSMKFVER